MISNSTLTPMKTKTKTGPIGIAKGGIATGINAAIKQILQWVSGRLTKPIVSSVVSSAVGCLWALTLTPASATARDFIRIAGSSTVYPYTSLIAESWSKITGNKPPVVESIGTGGGFKNFCSGLGDNQADIAAASRPIKKTEWQNCQQSGVTNIIELKIGYDGIVLAQNINNPNLNLSVNDIFIALAANNPNKNKAKTWQEVNSQLPNRAIRVYGPGTTSGTRDSFIELAMQTGAEKIVKGQTKEQLQQLASNLRKDGGYIDIGENDNIIVTKLKSDRDAFGIFGYDYLIQNQTLIKAVAINNHLPSTATILSGQYPLARPLFIYVKADNLKQNPNLKSYLNFFFNENNIGEQSTLAKKGLVPLNKSERERMRKNLTAQKLFQMK